METKDTVTLLDHLAAEPAPIRTDPDGVPRIGSTRVRLETVITAFSDGCGAEEIVLKYPTLDLKDVYAVIAYYLWRRTEIDAFLAERVQLAEASRREVEARFPPHGVRDRLLARQARQP